MKEIRRMLQLEMENARLRKRDMERDMENARLREEIARLKNSSGIETEGTPNFSFDWLAVALWAYVGDIGDGNKRAKSTGGNFAFEFYICCSVRS
jgi:hypothetical protein